MTPNAHPDKGGDIEIPEEIMNWINEQVDKRSFQVPYDGSNKFYDETILKETKGIALDLYRHLYPSLKEKEERIEMLFNEAVRLEGAGILLEESRKYSSALQTITKKQQEELTESSRLLSEAIEQNRLLIIRVEEKNALLSKGSHDFAALNEIVIQKDKEIAELRRTVAELQQWHDSHA